MRQNGVQGILAALTDHQRPMKGRSLCGLVTTIVVISLLTRCASQNSQQSNGSDDVMSQQQANSSNAAESNQGSGNGANSASAANAAGNNVVNGGSAENFAAADGPTNSANSASLNSEIVDAAPDATLGSAASGDASFAAAVPLNGTNTAKGQFPALNATSPVTALNSTGTSVPMNTVNPKGGSTDAPSAADSGQNMASSPGVLKWVGYNYRKDMRKLEIQVVTEGSPTYRVFQETNRAGQSELVARFLNTSMRQKLRRDIDATEFRSPVAYIRMRHNPSFKHTDVIMTLREPIQPRMVTKGSNVMFTFEIPEHWFAPKDAENPVASAEVVKDDAQGLPVTESGLPGEDAKLKAAYVGNPGGEIFGSVAKDAGVRLVPKDAANKELVPVDGQKAPSTPASGNQLLENKKSPFFETRYSVNGVAQADFSADIPAASPGSDLLEDAPADAVAAQSATAVAQGAELVGVNVGSNPVVSGKKVLRLDFRDAPVSQIIRMIAAESGINFIISPDAGAKKTSISLKNVAWDVALKAVLESNRLGMQEIAPGLVRIDFLKTFTEDRDAEQKARQATEALNPTKVLVMPLNYAKAEDAAKLAQAMMPKVTDPTNAAERRNIDRFKVQADPRSNSVIVEATPNVLSTIKVLLERLDAQTPQVRIASRLVEITNDATDGLGVAFNTPFSMDPGRGLGFGTLPFPNSLTSQFSVDPGGAATPGGTAAIRLGSINNLIALDLKLRAYETRKKAETLQNQDVVVQDNEKAVVSAGSTDYFTTAGGVGTAGTIVPIDYVLSLNVTPHITADGSVQMKLEIKGDSPNKSDTAGGQASKNSRSLTTTLLKKSGETAVIGGLYSSQVSKTNLAVPFFSKLPIIGALFRSVDNSDSKKDLLIMVTPTIVGSASGSVGGAAGEISVPPAGAASNGSAGGGPVATNMAPSQNGNSTNGQASKTSLESN